MTSHHRAYLLIPLLILLIEHEEDEIESTEEWRCDGSVDTEFGVTIVLTLDV